MQEPPPGPLRFRITHSVLHLQHKNPPPSSSHAPSQQHASSSTVPTLTVDLKDGSVRVLQCPPLPEDCSTVMGVIGLLRLQGGSVLIMASKAKKVCALPCPVFKVTATQLVTHENVKKTMKDLRLAHLLQEAMDVKTYGQHFFFSYERDLTRTTQATHQWQQQQQQPGAPSGPGASDRQPAAGAAGKAGTAAVPQWVPLCSRADERFLVNRTLLQPLIDGGAAMFALPLIVGYVGQLVNPVFKLTSTAASVDQGSRMQGAEGKPAAANVARDERQEVAGGPQPDSVQQQQRQQQQQAEGNRDAASPAAAGLGEGQEGGGAGNAGNVEDEEEDAALGWSQALRHGRQLEPGEVRGHVTLIARMTAARQGTLLWRKGLDLQGNVAHLVEVEQTLTVELPGGEQRCVSHVQVRSTSPILCSQTPDVLPVPRVRVVRDMGVQADAFGRFAARQVQCYCSSSAVGGGGAGPSGAGAGGGPEGAVTLLHLPCGIHGKDQMVELVLRSVVEGAAHHLARGLAGRSDKVGRSGEGGEEDEVPVAVPIGAAAAKGPGAKGPMVLGGGRQGAGQMPPDGAEAGTGVGRGGGEGGGGGEEVLRLVIAGEGVRGLSGRRGLGLVASEERQALLWRQVEGAVRAQGYWRQAQARERPGGEAEAAAAGGSGADGAAAVGGAGGGAGRGGDRSAVRVVSAQRGVLHTACWDGVDEGQVVQLAVALRVLEQQLRDLGFLEEEADEGQQQQQSGLEQAYPEVLEAVRLLWNHQGNVTADQVSGVGSMAGPALRTGELATLYRLTNLYFRAERWFHGAFLDARKQDAIDLVTGAYQCSPNTRALTKRDHSYSALEVGGAMTLWGLSQLYYALAGGYGQLQLYRFLLSVLLPLVAGLVLLAYGMAQGVERPQLCPELIAPGEEPRVGRARVERQGERREEEEEEEDGTGVGQEEETVGDKW